jgi:hypothetical protein
MVIYKVQNYAKQGGAAVRRLLIALLCCLLLTTAVSASTVTDLQNITTVQDDGTCRVTVTFQLQLDEVPGELHFPLPATAKDISVNGGLARTHLEGSIRKVELNGIHAAGTYTFTITYSLPDAVLLEKENLTLSIPLLSGFAYPIAQMRFAVTLPGTPDRRPEFVSTYHQESAESLIDLLMEGNTISGTFRQELKDHESLTMTLAVTEELFPQPISKKWSISTDDIAAYACAALALLYWLLTMRALPPRHIRRAKEPEGLSAGEVSCVLTGQGVDLTMMVVSWARMGYLRIHMEDSGRVLLHKRMDMGNERSEFENRLFRSLFGKRVTVDGTGYHYARLMRKAMATVTGKRDNFRRRSGNVRVFRIISAVIGFISGISLTVAFASDTVWQVLLGTLLCLLGVASAWQIQAGAMTVHLRRKASLWMALGASVLWVLLSAWAGEWTVAVFLLSTQWLTGLAAAYGGRRTEAGRQNMAELLGLRRYMRSVPKDELKRILRSNPEYYHNLAPFAMAMGVDKAFAQQFGQTQLPACSYLTSGMDGHMTADEWNQLLRDAVATLDEKGLRLPYEKLLGR